MPKEVGFTQAYVAEAVGVTREYMRMMKGSLGRAPNRTRRSLCGIGQRQCV